jgi:hypothetical protein
VSEKKEEKTLIDKVRELEAVKADEEAERKLKRQNTANILGEKIHLSPPMSDDEARKLMGRYSRRNFLVGGGAAILGGLGYRWLRQPEQDWIFRRNLEFNESLAKAYFSPDRLAPEFPPERIGQLRVNGGEGMSEGFDPEKWRLQVVGVADEKKYQQYKDDISYESTIPGETDLTSTSKEKIAGLQLTMDDIRALPRVEMITELKCIEGWSTITHWAGARFSDFLAKFPPPKIGNNFVKYVQMITPDSGYFVGMDMQSMLHPQTLLCYEMNFAPLTLEHGAPLRLVTTTKYGIKQIKRIGRIVFTDNRPKDFWAEEGYDWYVGH